MDASTTPDTPTRTPRYVDFASVPPSQWKIHDRLLAWARWCDSRPVQEVSCGFELHKSDEWTRREHGAPTSVPVNKEDAAKIHAAVGKLPLRERQTLQWYYVKGGRAPMTQACKLGIDRHGLLDLLLHARTLLINAGI